MRLCDQTNRPTGVLEVSVYSGGQLIERWIENNLVVDESKPTLAHLLGGDVANRSVTQFGVGTNGTGPASGDTSLTGAFIKELDEVSYPATNQVQFDFSLLAGDANGMAIREFALLTEAGAMFSRKTRSVALNKASDISISGSWTITF